jgi:hypothetical protein
MVTVFELDIALVVGTKEKERKRKRVRVKRERVKEVVIGVR